MGVPMRLRTIALFAFALAACTATPPHTHRIACDTCARIARDHLEARRTGRHFKIEPRLNPHQHCAQCEANVTVYEHHGHLMLKCPQCAPEGVACEQCAAPAPGADQLAAPAR
jgi:hypothetical protein